MSEDLLAEILRENNFPGNSAAFAGLKEYMAQGDLTALTGAGVSAPIFPTWIAMLSKWLDDAARQGFINDALEVGEYKELLKNDPLELAEFLEQILTKPIFRARLAEVFRNKSSAGNGLPPSHFKSAYAWHSYPQLRQWSRNCLRG
jgi:hypothetical protein